MESGNNLSEFYFRCGPFTVPFSVIPYSHSSLTVRPRRFASRRSGSEPSLVVGLTEGIGRELFTRSKSGSDTRVGKQRVSESEVRISGCVMVGEVGPCRSRWCVSPRVTTTSTLRQETDESPLTDAHHSVPRTC